MIDLQVPDQVRQVFSKLHMGYHLSPSDGAEFEDISIHAEAYRKLFDLLGFSLNDGREGFYYFVGEGANKTTRKMTAFVFTLFDTLSDAGRDPASAILQETFSVDALPHLERPAYRQIMAQVETHTTKDLESIIGLLVKYGFADAADGELRFRKPVMRFVDRAMAVANQAPADAQEDLSDD